MRMTYEQWFNISLLGLKNKHKALLKKQGDKAIGTIKQEFIEVCKDYPDVEKESFQDYVRSLKTEIEQEEK